jgi:hypothetical protein
VQAFLKPNAIRTAHSFLSRVRGKKVTATFVTPTGHTHGTQLSNQDKEKLLEYLKML